MQVPNYEIGPELVRHGPFVVYRGRRTGHNQPVLLKVPSAPEGRGADDEELRRELDVLASMDVAGVPRACELVRAGACTALAIEDHGLTPLRDRLQAGPLEVSAFFTLALEICRVLGELHRRRVTHACLAPSSVLVTSDGRGAELINVGVLPRAAAWAPPAGAIAPYISPEQTGRMNRVPDHRTDFYSLGATFYEMLTGRPPFAHGDLLELLHAHIARAPAAPSASAAMPDQLSRVILKMLAKAPEDRYQSASGLAYDLERCRDEWDARRTIAPFEPGGRDIPDQFLVSQKLYGRDREVDALRRAFDDMCEGRPSMMLVAGYSGIGKTSLIHELYRPIVRERGYFISGKFDQVLRNIPYGAVTQAFRSLVWQILTESEERLAAWRTRLADALGANGGVLVDVIPEIELIVGPQAPAPPLDPVEARNRFGYVFQSFVAALARREHPLIVFLDDLQWADAATLELLQGLLTADDIRHLLVIGAYRDNEVDAAHPLARAVDRLESTAARVTRLALGPLELGDLTRFLSDTLRSDEGTVEPLARLIRAKTDGNPFFVIQFLKALEQEGHFVLDRQRGAWTFRLDAVAAAGMTDNVVDLMTRRILRLSADAQRVLTLAACIGNPFDWDTLATVSRQPAGDVGHWLAEAVTSGLIQAVGDPPAGAEDHGPGQAAYAFLHDRVQQAAYGLIPETERLPVHLDIGRLLLADVDPDGTDDWLFAVTHHLNMGAALITDAAERLAVARLNLAAGRKAKTSAAYPAAREYFSRGVSLLDESAWRTEYELMFSLRVEAAECAYLSGAFVRAEEELSELLSRGASASDEAQVRSLQITLYEHQSRWADALRCGRAGLALFDITFPESDADKLAALDEAVDAVRRLLGDRSIASLLALPEMTDPDRRMALRLLTILWAPAYIAGDETLARLISATIVRLSLTHGNAEDSAYGYVTHAITVGPIRKDYRAAYEWGELALEVNDRFRDVKRRAKIHQQFQAHVNLWCRPFETCIPHAREACRSGLEAGDFTYAGYGAATEAWSAWLVNRDLDQFVRDHSPTLTLLGKSRMDDFLAAHQAVLNWALALQGRTRHPWSLSDAVFDEDAYVARYAGTAPFFLTFVQTARLHLSVLFERYQDALAAAALARGAAVTGTIWPVLIDFWEGVAAASALDGADADHRPALLKRLTASEASLRPLADTCPENFRCWWLILQAERSRVDGRLDAAAHAYEDALAYARRTGHLQLQALANERRGFLSLVRGDRGLAGSYIREARACYATWGAAAKVAQIETRYAALIATGRAAAPAESVSRFASPHDAAPSVDMATVLKVAHAIAVEIELDGLLRKLLKLALENAGAQRGVFFQERDGALVAEAEATADPDRVTVSRVGAPELAARLALSVVRYVQRTGQDVVIADARADERFTSDPYIARGGVRSILCVPVGQQGRVGGILYLENNLTGGAFTADRAEMMRILAAQTAISLENARLYEEMKNEVRRRTVAETALRDALSQVEALKDRLEAENVYLQEEIRTQHNFNEIVGNSPALLDALRKVERVAPTESTVLIVGETGSGKELFARAVHSRSRRRNRPLVKVNCGAIAPGLVESELFGHVKGAFTGAIDKRVGRFELADGGTIFLDEVGELPMEAQVKLLRVLQEQEFEPVGSSRTVRVSVRVIAATNRNLDQAVRDGRFRADLLYRLNVFPVHVPPLRERLPDLGLLVGFFSTALSRKLGKPIHGVTTRSMERMKAYSWPGNVRELQNVVERAAILAQTPILDLEREFGPPSAAISTVAPAWPDPAERTEAESLEDVQRLHILSVLKSTGGRVEGAQGAAAILRLHPNTLRSRMKKLGIVPPRRLPTES